MGHPVNLRGWALPSLAGYQGRWLSRDIVAGLVLSALLVPQGMAYAELAGLPAVTGLYTSILCLIGYALVGPSRILVLGPDSSLGPMIAATILPLVGANGDPAKAILLASALAILTGVIMIAAGAGHLGFVADLLSKPTILGYMNGLALTILVGQLPKLLGFSVDADGFIGEVVGVVQGIVDGEVVLASAAIGLVSLAIMIVLGRVLPKVPAVLVAVVVAIGLSIALSLAERGVAVVGPLEQGMPQLTFPSVGFNDLSLLVLGALGISLVALADTISTATSFAERQGVQVDGNREMIGIGTANVAAGLFQGFPVSTSGSRTAVAEKAGSRTQLTGLVGAAMIALMLIAFPDLLADLPAADPRRRRHRRVDLARRPAGHPTPVPAAARRTSSLSMAAFLGVVLLGVLPGIVLAIVLSVANVFRRIWWPYRHDPRPRGRDRRPPRRDRPPGGRASRRLHRAAIRRPADLRERRHLPGAGAQPGGRRPDAGLDHRRGRAHHRRRHHRLRHARGARRETRPAWRASGVRRAQGPGPSQDRPLRTRARPGR